MIPAEIWRTVAECITLVNCMDQMNSHVMIFGEEGWQVEYFVFKYSEINTADFSTFASGKVNHESSFPNLKLVCAMDMKLCRSINELKKF